MILNGPALDMLRTLDSESVDCIVTSPPYWGLRAYTGEPGMIGLEPSLAEYMANLLEVFQECYRVLKPTGTMWVNMGDAYAGSWGAQSRGNVTGEDKITLQGTSPLEARRISEGAYHQMAGAGSAKRTGLAPKNLMGQPWRLAFALQDAGWILRSDIIWEKPTAMPSSVKDRPTVSHEYIFLFAKSRLYYYNAKAIAEPCKTQGRIAAQPETRNARTVWTIGPEPFKGAHFAAFPSEIPRRCISAGCPVGGVVLDPFAGTGTTAAVALSIGRRTIAIEISAEYCELIRTRIEDVQLPMHLEVEATA